MIDIFGLSRFPNWPVKVRRFQAIHRYSVDVAHGIVLPLAIGANALPVWDSKTRRNILSGCLAVKVTAGPSERTIKWRRAVASVIAAILNFECHATHSRDYSG